MTSNDDVEAVVARRRYKALLREQQALARDGRCDGVVDEELTKLRERFPCLGNVAAAGTRPGEVVASVSSSNAACANVTASTSSQCQAADTASSSASSLSSGDADNARATTLSYVQPLLRVLAIVAELLRRRRDSLSMTLFVLALYVVVDVAPSLALAALVRGVTLAALRMGFAYVLA